ncbi:MULTISPECIES: DUF1292 domain-containing protein [Clostridium]|uniref:Conserved protein n=1 Tax=Clostridium novyi (strain NT) TaxID=386415 RepID=A0PZX6_CLONN|nr:MULTISPECIES: DUF1292 domain-containing protein [Clostridium]ABK62012.1 conserved protein [Clostridium novyi NT]KEH88371.1 hypothetical protein Z966_03705 [Clostridium novyi A str. NCTC 538]KEH88715.1 hypothetical protein Z967_01470 [Clostridium novyi A str. 4540]KEH89033.1 hypothetical protein Z965_04035 [Clostridium novyi A str. BKT29909]KEH94338.1 hypothetical protein Z963_10225 [Clostridium botulinum C/D str. It1]
MDKEKLHDCACGGHDHDHNHGDCGCGGHDHEHEACGCGCHEHESLIVELEDENGNTVPCEVIDGFEYKENEYALVQNPEDNSVYLFKVIGEGEEGQLVVPDDNEFNEVTAYYETLLENEE